MGLCWTSGVVEVGRGHSGCGHHVDKRPIIETHMEGKGWIYVACSLHVVVTCSSSYQGLVLTALVLNLGEDLPSFVLTYPFHNIGNTHHMPDMKPMFLL